MEKEGGSEAGLVQGTPGLEVREQMPRLGVGRACILWDSRAGQEGKGSLGQGRIHTRWEGAALAEWWLGRVLV